MIKRTKLLNDFEHRVMRKERANYFKNYRIWWGMYQEAVHLGIFPLKNSLDGIEKDIRIARVINRV